MDTDSPATKKTFRARLNKLGDETSIPLKWVFGLLACSATIIMVAGGLVLWGARLEAKTNQNETGILKIETAQDRYSADIIAVKSDLRLIKRQLKIRD